MAELLADLHNTVIPDFAVPEFEVQCQVITNGGIAENDAIAMLINLWTANNNREQVAWVLRQADCEQARLQEEQAEAEEAQRHAQAEADLLAAAELEERKKHKNKYQSFHDAPVLSGSVILLCPLAQTKMQRGNYCELWYFKNAGLEAVEKLGSSQDDLGYVTVRRESDDSRVLVVSSAADLPALKPSGKGSTAKVIPDEDLSWEDFLEAVP